MELINKTSKVIRDHEKFARFSPFIRFQGKCVYFPVSTVELANMKVGRYVHFVDMGDTTMFLVNDNPDGYKLGLNSKRDNTVRIFSAALVSWFKAKHGIKEKSISYTVIRSSSMFQGEQLFEILTFKPRPPYKRNRIV